MKVLHVISGLSRSSGGPARSSQGLVAAECAVGVDACIWPLGGGDPWIPGVRKVELPLFTSDLHLHLKKYDLIHLHGLWDPRLHKVAVACRKAGVPYIIAPRGMLEPWSLKQKWLKKRIARFLYQDRDLKLAAALHATAASEEAQFRALGFKNPVIISPNGVNLPKDDQLHCAAPGSSRSRRALFVSRMHKKKGVLELVEAWARIRQSGNSQIKQWCSELVYTVNSDEERAYEQQVKARVKALDLEDCFIFTGSLNDDAKWDAYSRADLFVLPTYSENFGIVVAEALWAGVPVITTKGTPWSELEEYRCGWWTDVGVDACAEALDKATSMAPEGLKAMGHAGHALVESKYTWAAVTQAMVEGYGEILK